MRQEQEDAVEVRLYSKHPFIFGVRSIIGSDSLKKFEGLLFCTDLDGTLYATDKSVSKANLDAIEYFKSQGGLFTFITGRPPQTAAHICNLVHPNAPYGCLNGAGIYNPWQEQYLWKLTLPNEMLELVREVDKQLPEMGIQFNTEKNIYFNKDNSAMVYFRAATGLPNVACHFENVEEPVLKVVFGHMEEEQILALQDLLINHPKAAQFDFIRSEKILYEILPKGASKGLALSKMAELLRISPEKTIAVGDYNNDISMVKAAGAGFAVDNAVPEVKAVADYVTVSNDDSAIAAIVDLLDRNVIVL